MVDIDRIISVFTQLQEDRRKEDSLKQKSMVATVTPDRRFVHVVISTNETHETKVLLDEKIEVTWSNLGLEASGGDRRQSIAHRASVYNRGGGGASNQMYFTQQAPPQLVIDDEPAEDENVNELYLR